MNLISRLALAGAGIAALLTGGAASAAIMTAIYSGNISGGFDQTGEFGAAGTNLSGQRFVATYKYDTSLGQHQSAVLPNPYEIVSGGPAYGTTSPILQTTLQIGNAVYSFYGNEFSSVSAFNNVIGHGTSDTSSVYLAGFILISHTQNHVGNSARTPSSPPNINANMYFNSGIVQAGGDFLINTYDYLNNGFSHYAYGSFETDTILVTGGTPTGGTVPEPASWALMIAGFGMVGGVLRRRNAIAT